MPPDWVGAEGRGHGVHRGRGDMGHGQCCAGPPKRMEASQPASSHFPARRVRRIPALGKHGADNSTHNTLG